MGEVSYQQLFDVLRKERSREELQDLPEDFFSACSAYISGEQAKLAAHDSLSSEAERLRTEVQNALKMLKELYDRREKKVMHVALNKVRTGSERVDSSSLLASERTLLKDVLTLLTDSRSDILPVGAQRVQTTMREPKPANTKATVKVAEKTPQPSEKQSSEGDGARVIIKRATPKFLGSSNQSFGPFKEGAQVELPERIARILVKKGRAELLSE